MIPVSRRIRFTRAGSGGRSGRTRCNSCSIGQALALGAGNDAVGALLVVDAEARAGVIPEVKFRDVAVQMMLGAMLVDADHLLPRLWLMCIWLWRRHVRHNNRRLDMGASGPSPQPVPPIPAQAQPATLANPLVAETAASQRMRAAALAGGGFGGTIATSAQGVGAPTTALPSLVGGSK